jgi:hypothetical protein
VNENDDDDEDDDERDRKSVSGKKKNPHPFYDDAFRFLDENPFLRFSFANELIDDEYIPGQVPEQFTRYKKNCCKHARDNQKYYAAKPKMKTDELVQQLGDESQSSSELFGKKGIYSVPLTYEYIQSFNYWQFENDPMHIISNSLDYILNAIHGDNGNFNGSFILSKKLRTYFDELGSQIKMPSRYRIPYVIIRKKSISPIKTADKFTLCSELFVFLYSSTITRDCPGFHPRMAALHGFVICLHRLISGSFTEDSLKSLEQDLALYIYIYLLQHYAAL